MLESFANYPSAGNYNNEVAYNCDTEKYDWRKLKVICPNCENVSAPLCSKATKLIESGWRWVGCDHKEPYARHESECRSCHEKYRFDVYTPQ